MDYGKKSLLQQECLKRGLLFLGIHFTTLAHTEKVIEETLNIYGESLSVLKKAVDKGDIFSKLQGEPVSPVFRAR